MRSPIVVAYGMGVDSTAMLIGWQARGLQVPAAILFADTGSEKPETYEYLPVINGWLQRVGYPQVTVLKRASPRAGDSSLHGECFRKSVLPSLAYGGHSCSLKWKLDPQVAWLKQQFGWTKARRSKANPEPVGTWAHGPEIIKLIGYDAGPADARRIGKARDKWPEGHVNRYPLHEWGWDRARCEAEISAAGLPVPMKSACFMCPASKKHEIFWLQRTHPELAARAINLEERAKERGLTSVKGLGRNFAWSDAFDQMELVPA